MGIICSKVKYLMALLLIASAGSVVQAADKKAAAEKDTKRPFVVIDSIHYRDKGNVSKYGMKNYTIFYGCHIWSNETRKKEKPISSPPSDKRIAGLVKNITAAKSPVIYDIEHWPLDIRRKVSKEASDDIVAAAKKTVDASMKKMIHIISESRKVNPNVKYGYYACVPLRNYWTPVKNNPEQMKKWREANDYLKPLADAVDVICPSLYAFYGDHEGWVKYAKANIAEAKRMANGKPVYAYLWPKYHNSNKKDGKKFIDGEFWKLQLETVYTSGIAGVIIWDSPLVVNNPKDKVWDPQRPWWQETVKFMKRIKK